ncbi:hypothetical protein BD779DRAFT_1433228 [Infundibulicybe gibba]|nr:hypothetical protein BD779DRAFT_1433228 [Infundibulicybe gibba]
MHPPHSYDSYPAQQPLSSSPTASQSTSFAPDQPPVSLPKIGQTRCYWALLSSDLHFIYLDPVLASHLEEQAELLVNKSLLSFVHPDEQASAKQDLGSVLESRTLHGSVTRVRFSRLSKVRRQLGYTGPAPPWAGADKIALDSNYMAVDIVINWAAEGLVLCFIHAIVDLNPNDNDERNKTGWTNWCGTPMMNSDQIQLLFRRLFVSVPQTGNMSRVFQILSNQPDRPLLLSWPPDQGQGQTGRDFAKLVEHVQIGTGFPNGNDAKTSCTRRYKALQDMHSVVGGEVESIFIPHGTVIFACHKVNTSSRSTATSSTTMQPIGYNATNYNQQQSQQSYYEQSSGTYSLPPLSSTPAYNNYGPQPPHSVPASYSPQRWSQGQGSEHSNSYNQWNSPSPAHSISPLPPSVSNLRSGSYPPPHSSQQWQNQSSTYNMEGANAQPNFDRSLSPGYAYSPNTGSEGTSPSADVVPPPRRRVSPGSTRDQYGPGGRSAGNRPMGVLKCSSCKATQSPEWRKGPSGKKELCNACGLRYARSRAKKEGNNQSQRRRKDKGITKRESPTPPTSISPSYSAMRRNYGDSSLVSTSSAGSGSGSDIYSHSGHHVLEEMTPSPSPPATHMNFVHYSPGADNRPPYSNNNGSFYSVPSPLSNPPVLHSQVHQHQHHHSNQLPRLGQIASYADRLSPMPSSASPVSHSPLASTALAASFERDKDRDRELRDLPPTPLSAEPRHARRSILTQQ